MPERSSGGIGSIDKSYYPGWQELVDDIGKNGGKILTYINPFLAMAPGHDQLFQEAKTKGYLVQHADGSPYLIRNANFEVGMIDLSNPDAQSWIKGVMKFEHAAVERRRMDDRLRRSVAAGCQTP